MPIRTTQDRHRERNWEIYQLSQQGCSNRQISKRKGISESQISRILKAERDRRREKDAILMAIQSDDDLVSQAQRALANALTRERFLKDKINRLTSRLFWLEEMRMPNVKSIRKRG